MHRNLRCDPHTFLLAIQPFREDLVVAVECIYGWYWLADLCATEGITFVLGHALYMRVIHGAKAKKRPHRLSRDRRPASGRPDAPRLRVPGRDEAVLFVAKCAQGRTMLTRLERKYPESKALSILAHKLGRAVDFMLARNHAFDLERFTRS